MNLRQSKVNSIVYVFLSFSFIFKWDILFWVNKWIQSTTIRILLYSEKTEVKFYYIFKANGNLMSQSQLIATKFEYIIFFGKPNRLLRKNCIFWYFAAFDSKTPINADEKKEKKRNAKKIVSSEWQPFGMWVFYVWSKNQLQLECNRTMKLFILITDSQTTSGFLSTKIKCDIFHRLNRDAACTVSDALMNESDKKWTSIHYLIFTSVSFCHYTQNEIKCGN